MTARSSLLVSSVLLLFVATSGCSDNSVESPEPNTKTGIPLAVRSTNPTLRAIRAALENGELEAARRLLPELTPELGVEVPLLQARFLLFQGDAVGALREVEAARQDFGGDGRVYATEAEVLSALGRLEAAEEAYRKGLLLVGPMPDLERARGVLRIGTPGQQREGLEALLKAKELDPTVPFIDWPLSQARLLVGRRMLAERPGEALVHARAGLESAPQSIELRELEADALVAQLDFVAALAIYAELAYRGRDLGDTRAVLHHRAATAALVAGEREQALEHYLAARDLGLDDAGLGFGVTSLADAAREAADAGFEELRADEFVAAQASFQRALQFEPESLASLQFLGVALFRQDQSRAAAEVWERLLTIARRDQLVLPDPVELNLARAWHQAGETARAREVLRSGIALNPEGQWSDELRFMLRQL